jgi:C_GCAxxG_C_C family probable redox protein
MGIDVEARAERARENFLAGYNCSQSVVMAFSDLIEDAGVDAGAVCRLASPFGGGMGRLREVCGCVSGSLMVLGLVRGYDDPRDYAAKKRLYAEVQELAAANRDENGSIVCRELLGLGKGPDDPAPERRSDAYYRKRPCPELCAVAARILATHLAQVQAEA